MADISVIPWLVRMKQKLAQSSMSSLSPYMNSSNTKQRDSVKRHANNAITFNKFRKFAVSKIYRAQFQHLRIF